ncbi:retinol dehydrogenase 7-like [Coccinella septempunctata]|uniref:retinol dehydrogenase 7-like n=1 Tax=Coccinella septempunctata TaxID=41139 RepID=UPI001D0870D7|nr:retinol dehydrogenase 7-like [Coccinella septempunctata]
MGTISKYSLTAFEILNEAYTAVGAGLFGMAKLLVDGFDTSNFFRTAAMIGLTGSCLMYALHNTEKLTPSSKNVIFITGCDSGLGFSFAQHMADIGFTVIAGFLNLKSQGAQVIKEKYSEDQIVPLLLDLTDHNNITEVVKYVEIFLDANRYNLYAVVNNAAIMIFGEFEWLTQKHISQQMNVNLLGPMMMTKEFLPLLRKYRGRIINISSHCSNQSLPGLSVYGATKYGLKGWSEALRLETAKYGIKVVNLIPGSFTTQSNIMANQPKYADEMYVNMSKEQKSFYNRYFREYHTYLTVIKPPSEVRKVQDPKLYELFEEALLNVSPRIVYKNEPWRYLIYHSLFYWSPTTIKDFFIEKFMHIPKYTKSEIDIIA